MYPLFKGYMLKFNLVFENSGDFIPFVSDNSDLLEYYIEFANSKKINNYSPTSLIGKKIHQNLEHLYNVLIEYNQSTGSDFTKKFTVPEKKETLLDQEVLNSLHCQWVHSNHLVYNFNKIKEMNKNDQYTDLLDKLPDSDCDIPASEILYKYEIKDLHNEINHAIHSLESSFNNIRFQGEFDQDWDWVEIKNIFGKKYTSNSRGNLQIGFNHYGRTLYNKFLYQSGNIFHDDENTYNQLLGFLDFSLLPAENIPYSIEYKNWCKQIGRDPGGDNLNIGKISNLSENLAKYRKIVYSNIRNQNKFSLVI